MTTHLTRSKLFVPASRPEFFDKALAGEADAISIDLEDGVAESRKDEARQTAVAMLERVARSDTDKTIVVRINARHTRHYDKDIAAIVRPGLDYVTLPKAESPADIEDLAWDLETEAATQGLGKIPEILATVESPAGLRRAAEIASAHHSVAGLQFGLADLFEPLGIDRSDAAAVHQVQFALRLAAGEAGVPAYDTAFTDINDPDGFLAEANAAKRLGFAGKSCIHPTQVPLANRVFQPSEGEIAAALRVVEASRAAEADGIGAFVVDGAMIDAPFTRRAEAVLATARRLGLVERN